VYGVIVPDYRARVADTELATKMRAVGAVLIEGPKACGKTATASRVAATVFDMDRDATARASIELNPAYLFERPTPILFDEWQVAPELWNRVRRAVDDSDRGRGLYLLTGSAAPQHDANRHSGAGRIGVLRMRPMSLFESGHSDGSVSVAALLNGEQQPGKDNGLTVPELMKRIVIGGWPDLLDADESEARGWIEDYLRQIIEVDIPSFVGRRDPRTLERVLASLGRFVAHSPAIRTIAADAGGDRGPIAPSTIYSHLDALDRLRLLDDSEAWQPHMRSRTRLRTTKTRYFVDPSIGTAALHVGSDDLLRDLNAAGFHFEALVVRDLRIYAQALGGRVDTWRDESGNEVDAIISLPGGRWAAIEIKMSQAEVDTAAAGLRRFAERIDTARQGEPAALVVITATGSAGQRSDGVHVAPITALAP
jgi:predicted AAA+ superfamily ATPase